MATFIRRKSIIYKVGIVFSFIFFNYYGRGGEAHRIGDNPYHRAAILDPPRDRFHLEWMVSPLTDRITFNLTVQTTGWILFGFANNGDERTGRDVVIGGVRDSGQVGQAYFSDRHTGRYNDKLELDTTQDYTLESSWQTGTHTFLSFSRDLDTCDGQDYPITENKVTLIWAFGDKDSEDANGGIGRRLSSDTRGTYDVYLMDPEYSPRVIRANLYDQVPRVTGRESGSTQVWTLTRSTRMPSNDTSYLCSIHKAPRLPRKHHIIGFDVIFADEQSRRHTHQIIVHKCRAPRGTNSSSLFESFAQSGQQQTCFSVSRPGIGSMPTSFCQQVYMVWASGGREYFTPDHVGFPFGEDPDEYYLVQVHYDNPNQRSDVTVSVNLDFFYTRRLRPNDGGIMSVGHEVIGFPEATLIPPQTPNNRKFGHCSGECTRKMLPKEGVTLVAAILHSHMSGKQLRLHHFRRNAELPWILYDDNYSSAYQQIRALPRGEVQILPGDQVTMDCYFDNTWTNDTVIGGFRTRQGMCLSYLVYYNLITDYTNCRSEIYSPSNRRRYLAGVRNVTWMESHLDWVITAPSPRSLIGRTITDVSDNLLEWDAGTRREFAQFQEQSVQTGTCKRDFHARDPKDIQELLKGFQVRGQPGELIVSGDLVTNVDTDNEYRGPVSYPGEAIPYDIPETTCLHKGIF